MDLMGYMCSLASICILYHVMIFYWQWVI